LIISIAQTSTHHNRAKPKGKSIMAIALIIVSDAIIGGVWIIAKLKARKREEQAANGRRLADAIR
jgi:hypothetical protein